MGKRRGGFGKLVRIVGRELVKRGFDVSVICWREPGEDDVTELDGMEILSYPYDFTTRSTVKHLLNYSKALPMFRRADADINISIDCLVETYLAQKVMPDRKHVIWVQDPFDENDYKLLGSVDPNYKINRLRFWTTVTPYRRAYKRADLVLTHARYFIPKIERLYDINPVKVIYLPNPVERIPQESEIKKPSEPLVCYLGRMDPQKRYWLFFKLARKFPNVEFVAVGRPCLLYEELYERIVRKYRELDNLKIVGFVNEEMKSEILSKSWVICLPSIREGLPIAFLEALAHKSAILSYVNPDNFAGRFGYHAADENFEAGLKELLKGDLWRKKGEDGYKFINEVHEIGKVIDMLAHKIGELR